MLQTVERRGGFGTEPFLSQLLGGIPALGPFHPNCWERRRRRHPGLTTNRRHLSTAPCSSDAGSIWVSRSGRARRRGRGGCDDRVVLHARPTSSRGTVHMTSNSLPSGSLRVERLAHAVVALADERAHAREPFAHLGEVVDRVDLPGEVVQPDAARLGQRRLRAEREQAEVVVVLGAGRPHEDARRRRRPRRPPRSRTPRGRTRRAPRVADVEHGVIESANVQS